jgi:uncharacterized spore protein YtfJ
MSLNQLFESIEKTREAADWRTAFGEPQIVEGKTLIPVAQVRHGFGLGFGSGSGPTDPEKAATPPAQGEGGGGGGGASSRPLGVLVVTPDGVEFEETLDAGKIAVAGIAMAALAVFQVALTLRAIFGRR